MNTQRDVDESRAPESGWLWTPGGGDGLLRVLEFAGRPVPEEGLPVSIPSGGMLTVRPDGRYEYAVPAHEGSPDAGAPVSTFYGYVAEDLYGEVVAGSFVLALGEDVPDPMHDFQAWSLPELLDGAVGALLGGDAPELPEFFGPAVSEGAVHAESAGLASPDPGLDDLTRLILDSNHS